MNIPLDLALNYETKYELTITVPRRKRRMNVEAMPTWIQWLHATWIAGAFRSLALNIRSSRNGGKYSYSRARNIRRQIMNVLLALSLAFMGVVAVTPAANALPQDYDIFQSACAKRIIDNADAVNRGSLDPKRPEGGVKMTAAERFGYASLRYPVWYGPWEVKDNPDGLKDVKYDKKSKFYAQNNGGCIKPNESFTTGAANFILQASGIVSGFTGMIYDSAARSNDEGTGILNELNKQVNIVVTGHDENDKPVGTGKGLRDTLYINYIGALVSLVAALILFRTLMTRRFTEALNDMAWLVGTVIAGILILQSPTAIPVASERIVSDVSGTLLSGITDTAMTIQPGGAGSNLCSVGKESTGADASSRQVQCLLWYGSSFRPWQIGTFGSNEEQTTRSDEVPAVDLGGGEAAKPADWSIYHLDQQWKTPATTQDEIDQKRANVMKESKIFVGDPLESGNGQVNTSWTGQDANKIVISLVGLVESLVSAYIVLPLSLAIVGYKLMITLLVGSLSFLLLLCGFPGGRGRKLAFKIGNTIVALILKQIMSSMVLGFAMTLLAIAVNASNPAVALFGMLITVLVISKFKDMLMDYANVSMGGAGQFSTPDAGTPLDNGISKVRQKTSGVLGGVIGGTAGAVVDRFTGGKGGGIRNVMNAAGSAGTQRASVPEALAGDGIGGATPATEKNSSSKATVRRAPAIPDAQGFTPASKTTSPKGSGAPDVSGFPVLSGKQSSAVKGANAGSLDRATAMMSNPRRSSGPKHRAVSSPAPVKEISFRKEGPGEAPKAKSFGSVVAAGAVKGGVEAARSGSTSISGGMNAGLEAGRGVAQDAAQEHEAALREAEREAKAAEKSEEQRYQERRKAAQLEMKAKADARKAQEKENPMSGALPRKTSSAPQGLPVRQSGGLPSRTSSVSGATGRRAATP
jgi:hypothetical protein